MKNCQEVQQIMDLHWGTDREKPLTMEIKEHIGGCVGCRRHHETLLILNRGIQSLDAEAEAAAGTIQWERVSSAITEKIIQKRFSPKKSIMSYFSNWKILVPAMTMMLLVGIFLGNFLSTQPSGPLVDLIPNMAEQASYDRMESTMARKEVLDYLKQSQYLMSDLMKQCSLDESTSNQYMLDKNMVRHMLNKNRYFNDHLNDSQLQNARRIIQKIRWLLYELSLLEGDINCSQMMKLQNYIQQEKLLFKTHLVEDEIQLKGSSEV